jgi:hypothetical protein
MNQAAAKVGRMVQSAYLAPAGMPPAAILIVRRLRTRFATAGLEGHWEADTRARLDQSWRRAVRPGPGEGYDPNCEAVAFADLASLLACLARDLARGTAARRWWWAAFGANTGVRSLEAIVGRWLLEPFLIPASIGHLLALGEVPQVLSAFSSSQVGALLEAMTAAFGVPGLTDLVDQVKADTPDDESDPAPLAPLLNTLPPMPGLSAERQRLVATAFLLQRAPLQARDRRTGTDLLRWMRNSQATPQHRSLATDSEGSAGGPTRSEPELLPALEPPERLEPSGQVARPPAPGPIPSRSYPPDSGSPPRDVKPAGGSQDHPVFPEAEGRMVEEANRDDAAGPVSNGPPVPAFAPPPAAGGSRESEAPGRDVMASGWTSTRVAGVFFLINALEKLRFFDMLTEHFGIRSAIGGWQWLTILARCLIPRRDRHLANDPLFAAFGTLEPSGQPAPIFVGSERYTLPSSWRPGAWRGPPRRAGLASGATGNPELDRFLRFVVPFLRWRLGRSLSLEPGEEIAEELLIRDGEVAIATSHIDVRMPLDQVRLSVRLAGLDANPGFVPALGRVITFHFV